MKIRVCKPNVSFRFQPHGFTLLEVIIACAIFFMCAFAILGVVTQGLSAARAMQVKDADIGMVLSTSGLAISNALVEGTISGDFEETFPGVYPGYSWQADILEVGSNSLFRVDLWLYKASTRKTKSSEEHTFVYLYAPASPPGSASKGKF